MRSWKEHFDAWHKISKTDLTPIKEDGRVLAGREAEDVLRQIVNENYSFKNCHSFAAKRVWDPEFDRKREIDLIVVTAKKIYVIECKNWSGYLYARGDEWIQQNPFSKTSEAIVHENTLDLNHYKMRLLGGYLRSYEVPLANADICQKVIFMNPKLEIQSREIKNHPDIITPDRLEEYLVTQNNRLKPHERFLDSVIGIILDDETKGKVLDGFSIERVGGEKHELAIDLIEKLPTWDKIFLRGTKILSGDVHLRESTIYADSFNIPFRDIKEIRISFQESKMLGFLKALFRFGLPVKIDLFDKYGMHLLKKAADPNGVITIQEAGSPETTRIDLCQIRRIRFGKYLETTKKSFSYRHAEKIGCTILGLIIGFVLLLISAVVVENLYYRGFTSPLTQNSIPASSEPFKVDFEKLTLYAGKYKSKIYSVTVTRKEERLLIKSKYGTEELNPIAQDEFEIKNGAKKIHGNYKFFYNKSGKITKFIFRNTKGKRQTFTKKE